MSKKYVSVLEDSAATPGYRIIAPEDYVYIENGTKKVKKIDSKADKKVPATAGNLATLDSTGNLADSGKQTTDFMNALTTAYDASGSATKTVTKVTQAKTGAVTVTYSDIQSGTTSQKGLVQLEDSTSSTSVTKAATPNSVKSAYDLANGKYSKPSGGIPSSDMDSTVQASLGKADTAIQGVKLNGSTLTPSSAKVVDLGNLKTKQTAVSDPSASGTTITAIATISQDANGVITATKKTIQSASQSQDGVMSAADKKKLDGISTGAEVNQNAFSNVKVGDVTVVADAKTDTLTLAAGSNVTITPDATNDKITIAAKDTTYTADAGIRLDGTVLKHTNSVSGGTVGPTTDTAGATLSVPYVTYDSQGHVTASGTRTHNVGTASTSGAGIVQLQDSIDATTTKAATPNAVKKAIEALDVSSVGGSGKYISAISENDGKISATSTTMDTTPTASSEKAVTSGGVKTALDTKADKASVTAATKCKITYNSQGIVTAGADLANTDMPKFFYNCGYASTRMNGAPAYDSSTPYKLIGKQSYNTQVNRTAWERFLLMYENTLFEFKLHGSWSSVSTGPSLTIRPISLYGTSLDTIKARFYPRYSFTKNAANGLVIEFYVMFTGDWQNYRLYQLPAQSGDVGSAEITAFTMSTNATAIATLPNTAIDFYNGDDKVTVFGHISSANKATNDSDGNAINATYFKSSGNVTLVSGTATKIGTQNGTDVKLTLPSAYSLPLAANGTRGGIQIGYSESGTNYAVKLSSEKAYVTVPWTDTKVTQTADDATDSSFEVLLSNTADNTTRTETARKSSKLKFNPNTGTLGLGGVIARDLGSGVIAETDILSVSGSTDGLRLTYQAATSDAGVARLGTRDDSNAKLSLGNWIGSTYKEAISVVNGSATVTGTLSGTATAANYLNYNNGNEINFRNTPSSGNKHRVWFNWVNGDTNAVDADNPITEYRFGNRNQETTGVTLFADNFTGNAATASTLKKYSLGVTNDKGWRKVCAWTVGQWNAAAVVLRVYNRGYASPNVFATYYGTLVCNIYRGNDTETYGTYRNLFVDNGMYSGGAGMWDARVVWTGVSDLELWIYCAMNSNSARYSIEYASGTIGEPIGDPLSVSEFNTYVSGKSTLSPTYSVAPDGTYNSMTVGVASKLGTANKGSSTKPIYLAAGVPTECTAYAGGTAVTLNNSSKAGSTASFYAPTAGGAANYVLIGAGTTSAPTWAEKAPKATAADTATKPLSTLLTSSDDLNNVKADSHGDVRTYHWSSGNVPANSVNTTSTGMMQVFRTHSNQYCVQMAYICDIGLYKRVLVNGTWGAWSKILAQADVTDTYSSTGTAPVSGKAVASAISGKSDIYKWNAVTQGQKWSRIFYSESTAGVVGSSGILWIGCTRASVVCNAVFLVTAAHNGAERSNIVELSSCGYSELRCRLVVNSSANYYFEVYDTANSIASGTTQQWYCRYIPLRESKITTYTAFTDGTTIPSNYATCNDFTITVGNSAFAIKNITRSGTTFTATRQNGSTFTFTQQDSDSKVSQTADDSTNSGFELLFSETADNTTRTEGARKSSKLKFTPSTGTLSIGGPISRNLGGSASTTIAETNILTIDGSTDGSKITYQASTGDLGITRFGTVDDANATLSLGNWISSTYKEAISIVNGSANVTGNSTTSSYPQGFASRNTSSKWGTLSDSTYTWVTDWRTSDGSEITFGSKSGQLSAQIDGYFYQNEGQYRVLDTSNVTVPTTVPTLAWNTESTLATIDGKNIKVKLPASPDTDTKVTQTADDASTGTGFELLFSATGDNTTRTEASRKSSKLTYQPSTGTIKSTAYNVNSKCTLQFNSTTNALDFVFA